MKNNKYAVVISVILSMVFSTVVFAVDYESIDIVKQIQQALNEAGYDCGTPDGVLAGTWFLAGFFLVYTFFLESEEWLDYTGIQSLSACSSIQIGICEESYMKRKNAKEILAESFREIADKKPVDKITITDITDNCDYSPSTFYRQFKDKYDLIAWDYMYRTEEMLSKVGVDGYSWKDVLLDGAKYYQKDKEYLGNLLKHTSGLESFEKYMADFNYRHFREYILKAMGVQNVDRICDQAIRVWCLGTVRLNCEWILGQLDVNAEEMADIYRESLPSVIKEYITD